MALASLVLLFLSGLLFTGFFLRIVIGGVCGILAYRIAFDRKQGKRENETYYVIAICLLLFLVYSNSRGYYWSWGDFLVPVGIGGVCGYLIYATLEPTQGAPNPDMGKPAEQPAEDIEGQLDQLEDEFGKDMVQ